MTPPTHNAGENALVGPITITRTGKGFFSVDPEQEDLFIPGDALGGALPGDTVFVPEEMNKTTFTQSTKDWTQIIYQLGLGAAAINAVK